MKIKTLICLLALVFVLPYTSCKKRLFDYRNKYLGDWSFRSQVRHCTRDIISGAIMGCRDTVIEFSGNVLYYSGSKKSKEIELNYLQYGYGLFGGTGGQAPCEVEKSGNFSKSYDNVGSYKSSIKGKFESKKSVSFTHQADNYFDAVFSATVTGTKK